MAEEKTTALKWKFETGNKVWSSPALSDGVVYVGSDDHHLYAVDTKTGEEKWKFVSNDVVSSPILSGPIIYFKDGPHLYCLDSKTGNEKWKFKTKGKIRSFAISDDIAYLGISQDCLSVLDIDTKKEKWFFETNEYFSTNISIAEGIIFFSTSNHYIYALDAKTGEEKWNLGKTDSINFVSVSDGLLYFGSYDNYLYVVDTKTGEEKWKFMAGDSVYSTPAVSDGVVYFGSCDGYFYALDNNTGEEKWKFKTGGRIFCDPLLSDGVIYIGSEDGYIYAVDIKSAEEKWKFKTGGGVNSSAVVSEGIVYFGSYDNNLYAVDIDIAEKLAPAMKIAEQKEKELELKRIEEEQRLEKQKAVEERKRKQKEEERKRKQKEQEEQKRLKKLEELEAEKRSHWKPNTEENLKKIRELMVSSQFDAGIELAQTVDDPYLLLELVDGCKIREDGTVTLNETFAANAAEEDYDILVCALFKMILIINDIQKPGSSLKLENIKVLNLCSFVKLPSNIDSFTNLETVLIAPKHSKSIPKKYSLIKDLQIKTALSAEEIVQALWDNGPADDIYNYSYETEVTHAEADYIENDGLGCERLEEVDPDADDYDPEETEKIKIDVGSYIDDNFEKDFFDKVNADTLIEESGSYMVSKEDIESTISSMLYDLCYFFNDFIVVPGSEENPWENEDTIYLGNIPTPEVSLEDINPDWTEDEYYLVD
jgi:outer membrane protein assembly factor BamB